MALRSSKDGWYVVDEFPEQPGRAETDRFLIMIVF
jgi:hypothetical protein